MNIVLLQDILSKSNTTIPYLIYASLVQQLLQSRKSFQDTALIGVTKLAAAELVVADGFADSVVEVLQLHESGVGEVGDFVVVEGEFYGAGLAERFLIWEIGGTEERKEGRSIPST